MWRPMAIFVLVTKYGNLLTFWNDITHGYTFEAFAIEMSIQRIKFQTIKLMFQDDGRTIIAKMIIICKAMDDCIYWSINRRACIGPYINAEVQAAWFIISIT